MGYAAIDSAASSDSLSPSRARSAPPCTLNVPQVAPSKSIVATVYDRISAAACGLPNLIPALADVMPVLGLDFLIPEPNGDDAVRDIQSRPIHTLPTLIALSSRAPYIERGKDAAVYPLARYPDLVLRVTHQLTRLPSAVKVIPVRYDEQFRALSRHPALGLVRAVIVDAQGPLAARRSLSAHEAATTPAALQLMLLNHCAGRQTSAAFNDAFLAFSLSPAGREIVRARRHALERAGRPAAPTEQVRDITDRARARSAVSNLQRRLELLQLTPEARDHQALYDSVKMRVADLLACGDADDYCDLRDAAADFLATADTGNISYATGRPIAAATLAEFTQTYTEFVQAYSSHIATLAALPQRAYDSAVSALALTHSLPDNVNINLNHGGNTLIDAERGEINFVDLDFAQLYARRHLDALALVLLGKGRLVHRHWQAILGPADRASLAPKIAQIFTKLTLAGRRNRLAWPAEDSLKLKQIFWHFDLPELQYNDLPFDVSRVALTPGRSPLTRECAASPDKPPATGTVKVRPAGSAAAKIQRP